LAFPKTSQDPSRAFANAIHNNPRILDSERNSRGRSSAILLNLSSRAQRGIVAGPKEWHSHGEQLSSVGMGLTPLFGLSRLFEFSYS